jgi:hypothetical protein
MRQDMRVIRMTAVEVRDGDGGADADAGVRRRGRGRASRRGAFGRLKAKHHRPGGKRTRGLPEFRGLAARRVGWPAADRNANSSRFKFLGGLSRSDAFLRQLWSVRDPESASNNPESASNNPESASLGYWIRFSQRVDLLEEIQETDLPITSQVDPISCP